MIISIALIFCLAIVHKAYWIGTTETNPDEIIKHQQRVKTNTIQIVDKLASGTYADIRIALPNIKLVQVIHVIDEKSVAEAIRALSLIRTP